MDDIDCRNTVLDENDLIEGIEDCEDCNTDEEHSVFNQSGTGSLNDQSNEVDCRLKSSIVIVSNDDSVSGNYSNASGEGSSELICAESANDEGGTYIFTIDDGTGLIHSSSINLITKLTEDSDKEDPPSVSQAWFTSRDDKIKLQKNGHQWKQGMWSKEEADLLDENIKRFCIKHGVADPAEVVFEMTKDERKDFYRAVSKGLNRPLFSVYRRVIRMYDKKNHIGRYTPNEQNKLKKLHEKHGNDWQTIGTQLGRSASSIKDKCRLMKDNCNVGKWFPNEEKLLAEAVYDLSSANVGEVISTGISWAKVAEKVKTRSEKQCRTKWLNYLNWKHAGGSEWTREDDVKLVNKMYDSEVDDENDVDWAVLSIGWKSVRSPQWLRGKWWNLKRHVPNATTLKFKDICRQLYAYHIENTKFINHLNNESESTDVESVSGVELLTPTTACLTLPQVRFVSIPSVVQIPSSINIESSRISSSTATAVLKSSSLQTFEIVSPNLQLPTGGSPGTFFITSQGTAVQYPSSTLPSSSPIILQTISTDSIQMNVPAQLIITDAAAGLISQSNIAQENDTTNVSQFSQSLLSTVQLPSDEIVNLDFDDDLVNESESVHHTTTTVQTDLDQSDQSLSAEFILSDPILQGPSGSLALE
ncbi:Cyclin-D-binding Myb-like transcription factor 1 [Chamberlinius hualienensis]